MNWFFIAHTIPYQTSGITLSNFLIMHSSTVDRPNAMKVGQTFALVLAYKCAKFYRSVLSKRCSLHITKLYN